MSDEIDVSYFGLHEADGVLWLQQGRGGHNFLGLNKKSPYNVALRRKHNRACPHMINAASPNPDREQWARFLVLLQDPMVRALLPIPKQYGDLVPYVNDPNNELAMKLVLLTKMSSPIYPMVMPFVGMTQAQILGELETTNVAPLVLTGVLPEHTTDLHELAQKARLLPRKLLCTGDSTVVIRAPLQRLQTLLWEYDELELAMLPWETLGAFVLRRHARGETIDSEMMRK